MVTKRKKMSRRRSSEKCKIEQKFWWHRSRLPRPPSPSLSPPPFPPKPATKSRQCDGDPVIRKGKTTTKNNNNNQVRFEQSLFSQYKGS